MAIVPAVPSAAEHRKLMASCRPYAVSLFYYERPGSANRCVYEITVSCPEQGHAVTVAAQMMAQQVQGHGLIYDSKVAPVVGRQPAAPALARTLLFGRKP